MNAAAKRALEQKKLKEQEEQRIREEMERLQREEEERIRKEEEEERLKAELAEQKRKEKQALKDALITGGQYMTKTQKKEAKRLEAIRQ